MEKNEKDLAAGIMASEEASEVTMVMENDHGRGGGWGGPRSEDDGNTEPTNILFALRMLNVFSVVITMHCFLITKSVQTLTSDVSGGYKSWLNASNHSV